MDDGKASHWLSWLVTEEKVSCSTQKQTLNALVFFFRDVCGLTEVLLAVRLRQTPRRMPEVLTIAEVAAALANLPEQCRLAVELSIRHGTAHQRTTGPASERRGPGTTAGIARTR